MSDAVVGQVILFLTTVIGFALQIYREGRTRKWSLEDRNAVIAKTEQVAAVAETVTKQMARDVKTHMDVVSERVEEKINQNTAISENAFAEANNFNRKFGQLTSALDTVHRAMETGEKVAETLDIVKSELKPDSPAGSVKEQLADIQEAVKGAKGGTQP